MPYLMMLLLMLLGIFMMFVVLIQRGRGGGLAGALGGAGGQSAFGTKAGDVFTKITVVVAVLWVVLAGVSGILLRSTAEGRYTGGAAATAGDDLPIGGEAGGAIPPTRSGTEDSNTVGTGGDTEAIESTPDASESADDADDADASADGSTEAPESPN